MVEVGGLVVYVDGVKLVWVRPESDICLSILTSWRGSVDVLRSDLQ
jgi:hypothetical protein